ncbi:MAG: hypothetical protein B7Y39_17220 [Bdellovibrio sp. 28-41-41]|nr:MAG: hypothetical protein B7Y39_17220 [Bdellovibrio sp. 28-41-41]
MFIVKKFKFIAIGLLISSSAFADGVWVNGSTIQTNQYGAGQSTTTANLEVTYQKKNLPWGSEVFLVSGYRCQIGGSWQKRTYPEPMSAVSGFTWQRRFQANVADRYSGFCGHYEFVFLIKLPDGRSIYDNGGRSNMGFYSAQIPYNSHGSTSSLQIQALGSASNY